MDEFLLRHKVGRGEDYTHTILGNNVGCYYIGRSELSIFHDLYINSKRKWSITEKHKSISPILIDLDFRQETIERLYNKDYIDDFLNVFLSILSRYVDQNEMTVYILEKPSPRNNKSVGFKDGIHIMIPDVITLPLIQYKIRDDILDNYFNILKPDGVTNTADNIYDEAVIERNNWFLYGSKKPDEEHGWKVTYVYDIKDKGSIERDILEYGELVRELSLRLNDKEESRYTIEGKKCLSKMHASASTKDSVMSMVKTIDELDIIKELVNLLDIDRADNYQNWIKVGWCLHNIDDSLLDIWKEFSKKSPKYDEYECNRLWRDMRYEGLGLGSLHKWAKDDSWMCYMDLMSKMKSKQDEVNLDDIKRSSIIYDYNFVKRVFEKTHAKIINPICYFEDDKDDEILRDENKLRKTYRNLYFSKKVNGDIKLLKFIDHWLDDRLIKTYKRMNFYPPPLICPNDHLNLWQGFLIDKIESESSNNIDIFIEHAKILVGNDDKSLGYFIKWLAQLVQEPGKLNGIALIFISNEGAGKNIFWDKFASMIGDQYYFETADPERDLFDRFCNGRKYKLLIDLDEANTKDTFANSERLKNMITSEHFNYEQKGVDPIELRNFARLIFTTNNLLCAKITDNTRRYVIFETSNEKIGDSEYFKRFNNYMLDVKNQKAIMRYLREIDISNVKWINDRPISDIYNALKSVCADPLLKFVYTIWEKHRFDNTIIITASDLLNKYHIFLREVLKMKEESINIWNSKLFGVKLSIYMKDKIGIIKIKNVGPKNVIGYEINIGILMDYLDKKSLLQEDGYMFKD